MQLLTFFTLRYADEDELLTHVGLPLSDPYWLLSGLGYSQRALR